MKRRIWATWLLSLAAAQPAFLTSLQAHPQLRAARLQVEARALAARLAPNRLALDAQGGWTRRALDPAEPCPFLADPDPSNDVLCSFVSPDVPTEASQAEVGLTLRPLTFGDYADRSRLADLDLAEARLDYRKARAELEAAALRAALSLAEALQGLEVAREGRRLAEAALAATELRRRKGAANDADLRAARLALEDARARVEQAREGLELARKGLATFTSEPPPPPPWPLEPPERAEPASLARARIAVERARVALKNRGRDFWPTVELGYRLNLDDRSNLAVSLESRTLGARVAYGYATFADPARARTRAEWRVGARLNLSAETWAGQSEARLQLRAAEAALEAARRQAEVEALRLRQRIDQALRASERAAARLDAARADEREAQERQRLGLITPLQLMQTQLARLQAELQLQQAENDVRRARLERLVFLAVPPSEVWR